MKNTKWSTQNLATKFKEIHQNRFDYSMMEFKNWRTKIKIKCNTCNSILDVFPNNHLSGKGCKICVVKNLPQNQSWSFEQFIEKARTIHGQNYEYISGFKNTKSKIKIKCKLCNQIFEQRASSHLDGVGCKTCVYKNLPQNQPRPFEEFENLCKNIHQDKYEYFQDYRGLRHKIKIKCKKCKNIFNQEANAHSKHKQGCPFCNFSKGEIAIKEWLDQHQIKYEAQKKFDDCKNVYALPFDFYIADKNICIEYDGEQHFYPISYFGGEKRFKATKITDKIKTDYCEKNGIKLIRIPFYGLENLGLILDGTIGITNK